MVGSYDCWFTVVIILIVLLLLLLLIIIIIILVLLPLPPNFALNATIFPVLCSVSQIFILFKEVSSF
jgi:hypothetical protein